MARQKKRGQRVHDCTKDHRRQQHDWKRSQFDMFDGVTRRGNEYDAESMETGHGWSSGEESELRFAAVVLQPPRPKRRGLDACWGPARHALLEPTRKRSRAPTEEEAAAEEEESRQREWYEWPRDEWPRDEWPVEAA